ncbi:RNA polymerase sigma factor [Microbacterium saperdae]
MTGRSEDPNSLQDEVFTRLFDANWAALRHHIEGAVADDDEVTEIVSAVFLEAWTRLDVAKPMGRVWLFRAADRELRARTGRATSRLAVLDAVHHGMAGTSEEHGGGDLPAEQMPDRDSVLRALAVLTSRQRRIIMLAYWDGLTEGEISELTRYPRRSVRTMLRRAEKRMRDALGLEGAGEREG